MRPDRRTVLAGALAGAVATSAKAAKPNALILYDPAEPAARAFAKSQGGRSAPIKGDPIRLARRLFAKDTPDRLTIVARHADIVLLSEAAGEAGYRALASEPLAAGDLFLWTARLKA